MSETESETQVVEEVEGGLIQYIDMGHYTLEIDNRGAVQQRRQHPKAISNMPVTPQVAAEVAERVENEVKPLIEVRNLQQVDGSSLSLAETPPPVEDWEGQRDRVREAHDAIREANNLSDEQREEMRAAAAENTPDSTYGSESQAGESWTPASEAVGGDSEGVPPSDETSTLPEGAPARNASTEEWLKFARDTNVDVADDASRADIIAAVESSEG